MKPNRTKPYSVVASMPRPAHAGEYVGIDTEFFRMDPKKLHRPGGDFACASFAFEDGTVYQIYDEHDVREALKRVAPGKWIFHNAAFDIRQLRRYAEIKPQVIWDTMLAEQGLFGGYYSTFDLGALSVRWLDQAMSKDVRDDFATATEMTPETIDYAALDAYNTLLAGRKQMEFINETQRSMTHYWKADLPTMWATLDMMPVKIDVKGWIKLSVEFKAIADEVQSRYDINLNAPAQVKELLNKRFRRSLKNTEAETLEDLLEYYPDDPVLRDVLQFRRYAKAASTYGMNWIENHVEGDGYVYSDWRIVGADTGRTSSRTPNLQNIPSKKLPVFRTMFIAGVGRVFVVMDVAQQEPRILAIYSKDKTLTDILLRRLSPHIELGKDLFDESNFSKKDERYAIAKSINLGLTYGLTASGLSRDTGISISESERLIKMYFQKFPGVKNYIERQRGIAAEKGYVETLLGRRGYVNPYDYSWRNNAINNPIQGTAGDQIKIATGLIHKECALQGIPFSLCLLVHDETNATPEREYLKQTKDIMVEAWHEAGRMTLGDSIPVEVEVETGKHWGCKK